MSHVLSLVFNGFTDTVFDVLIGISPIIIIFLLLNIISLHLKRDVFNRIIFGFVITFAGLVLFLQGVHIAFLPIGTYLGAALASLENNWIIVPLGFVMGFVVAFAEPAVHVMIKHVEDLTSGTIKANVMLLAISFGVASAVALAMVRLLTGLPLFWILAVGYLIIFIIAPFTDKTILAMAFDNGGVATGPMCSTFILAMSVSIAGVIPGRDPLLDGFGIVALIAMAPILTTMLLSFIYKRKSRREAKTAGTDEAPLEGAELPLKAAPAVGQEPLEGPSLFPPSEAIDIPEEQV